MEKLKRILAIHDISCVGKCSITEVLPVISACGIECSILPTSLLSTHTGGFTNYTFLDLSDEMLKIVNHFKSLNLNIDAFYTGYLGNIKQIEDVINYIDLLKNKNSIIFVDPVMADDGKLYKAFDLNYAHKMVALVKKANVIIPNLTEACLLLDIPYLDKKDWNLDNFKNIVLKLSKLSNNINIVILSGTQDTFSPKFNYKGFQYVEVSASSPIVLTKNNLVAWEMHSDVPVKGTWHSSSDMLNRLWRATNRSYLSNLFGYPTDCPQREKNGWTGDAHLAMEVGLFNYDVITIYEKWMNDFIDEQRPDGMLPAIIPTSGWGYDWGNGVDWTSSIVIIPWLIYRYYGDDILLRRMYVPMKHFMECVEEKSDDYLTDWGLGDWIPVKSQSNVELVVSIYYYVDANIMSLIAERMGLENDKVYYESLAGKIKNAINQKYLSKCDGLYASGTQTELAMPLYWGVVPDSLRSKVAENLNKRVINDGYHLDVGVHGCKTLLGALSDNGFIDTAYKVVTQTTYPSWGYWIAQGATTLHENWRTDVIIDNSLNHIMFGEVGAWLYKSLAGIRLDENQPAFRKTHIKPYFPKDLECLDVSYKTSYGKLQLEWQKKGKEVIYHLHVPAAMEVVLTSPAGDVDNYGGGDYVFKWNVNYD